MDEDDDWVRIGGGREVLVVAEYKGLLEMKAPPEFGVRPRYPHLSFDWRMRSVGSCDWRAAEIIGLVTDSGNNWWGIIRGLVKWGKVEVDRWKIVRIITGAQERRVIKTSGRKWE
ncbi:hypothetical protein LR48_Vigan07g239200 [Vigna angularis]|uniref:Uncharacterized protein n=1 Tax=Phaseolus angularis TaxID=3914 RepID=A0A0L9V0X5_PHAAN|nr:hypothetical protein LR48_Vigan07g239200 [Vigna angularis]